MPDELTLLHAEMARREMARRWYADYLPFVHGKNWKQTRMAQYLASEVQAFIEEDTGNAYDILVIQTPPQHGKSITLTESLPSWVMGKYPDWRIILGSYNDESADRFARRNKEKVNAFGRTLFNVQIGAINRATEFELDGHLGRLISRGIMSGVTGNPANMMIIDDPIKNRQEADSPTYRRKLWDEWQNSFKSRLAAHAKVIVIATPWHEDDMMANLLRTEDNIRLIRLPVEAEENDPLGRGVGEALCPELGKDDKWLQQFKSSYLSSAEGGRRAWTALYQCSPRVEGGNLVHREWWRYYTENELPYLGTEVISVDAAFKDADNNDYVAITVWGKGNNDYYLRYCLNRHLDFTSTLDAIRQVRQLYPNARTVLIEDKANGSAIINVLQKEMFCVPVNPKGGKVARVNAVSAAIESGHVYVPADAPWVFEYLDQWSAFPAGAHDDMVDSSSQALSYLLYSSGAAASTNLSKGEEATLTALEQEKEIFLTASVYDVYGMSDIY
jgi:predicted phage terminase large subunit-like protein